VKVVKVLVQSEEVSSRAGAQFDADSEPILVIFMVERLDRGVDDATRVVCMTITVVVCVAVVRSNRAQGSRCSVGKILFDGQIWSKEWVSGAFQNKSTLSRKPTGTNAGIGRLGWWWCARILAPRRKAESMWMWSMHTKQQKKVVMTISSLTDKNATVSTLPLHNSFLPLNNKQGTNRQIEKSSGTRKKINTCESMKVLTM
jgi:hypothetical protein